MCCVTLNFQLRAELGRRGLNPDAPLPDDVIERMEEELREDARRDAAAAVIALRIARERREDQRHNADDSEATGDDD